MLNRVLFSTTEKHETFPPPDARYSFSSDWLRPTVESPKTRVYCIAVPRANFDGQASSFADFIEDEEVVGALGLMQNPEMMIKLIQTFHTAMTQPSLQKISSSGDTGGKRATTKNGGAAADAAGAVGDPAQEELAKKEKKKLEKKLAKANAKETFKKKNVGVLNRVEIGIQDILDKDGQGNVEGFRIWYFLIDDTVDPSNALVSLFRENAEKYKLKSVRDRMHNAECPSLERMMIRSAKEWVEGPMQCYQPTADNAIDFKNDPETGFYSIKDIANPAHVDHMLSFDRSNEMIAFSMPNADPMFYDPDLYTMEGPNRPVFPPGGGIRMLDMGDRRPAVLHHALLVEDERTRDKLKAATNDQHRMFMLSRAQERCEMENRLYSDTSVDVVAHCLLLNTEEFKRAKESGRTPAEVTRNIQKVRESSSFRTRLKCLFASSNNLGPGHKAAVQWITDRMTTAKAKKEKWSALRLDHSPVDRNMSLFAHYFSRCLNIFENVIGFGTVHQEMQMLNVWRLCAFDSRKKALFPHMMVFGAAATSKSHMQKITQKFSCANSYRCIGYETAKAYTDDSVYNNLLFIYDEMPRAMLDKSDGGEGDPMFKSILSDGKMRTIQMQMNPLTGRREKHEYECLLKALFWVNTNVTEADMPAPIASRFFTHEVLNHSRPEIDFLLKDEEMRVNPKNADQTEIVEEEMQEMEALSGCAELMIEAGFMPQISQTAALLRWNLIKNQLTKTGTLLEPRKDSHIMTVVRATTLMSSILHTFFTQDVFDEGKEFEWYDLMSVAPFLYSTEEHLVYGTTASEYSITNSNTDEVVEAIVDLCKKNKARDSDYNYRSPAPEGVPGQHDFSYFSMALVGTEPKQEEVLLKASIMLAEHIKRKSKKVYLARSIQSILKRLTLANIEGKQHVRSLKEDEEIERVDKRYKELTWQIEQATTSQERRDLMDKRDEETKGHKERLADSTGGSHASTFVPGQHLVGETDACYRLRMEKAKELHEQKENFKAELENFPVLVVTLNTDQRCHLEINRDYVVGKARRTQGFLMDAIEETQNKYTPRRRMVTGKTYRDKDMMVPYVFKTFDSKPNLKEARVLNLAYKSPGSEHMFCRSGGMYEGSDDDPRMDKILLPRYPDDERSSFLKDDEGYSYWAKKNREEVEVDTTSRYQTLKMNPDVYYYRRFLRDNHLVQPKKTKKLFPVCMTWKTETATYPERILREAGYSLMTPQDKREAIEKDMDQAGKIRLQEEREAREMDMYYMTKKRCPSLFIELTEEESQQEIEAGVMDEYFRAKRTRMTTEQAGFSVEDMAELAAQMDSQGDGNTSDSDILGERFE